MTPGPAQGFTRQASNKQAAQLAFSKTHAEGVAAHPARASPVTRRARTSFGPRSHSTVGRKLRDKRSFRTRRMLTRSTDSRSPSTSTTARSLAPPSAVANMRQIELEIGSESVMLTPYDGFVADSEARGWRFHVPRDPGVQSRRGGGGYVRGPRRGRLLSGARRPGRRVGGLGALGARATHGCDERAGRRSGCLLSRTHPAGRGSGAALFDGTKRAARAPRDSVAMRPAPARQLHSVPVARDRRPRGRARRARPGVAPRGGPVPVLPATAAQPGAGDDVGDVELHCR